MLGMQGTFSNTDFVGPWELPYNQYLTVLDLFNRYVTHKSFVLLNPWTRWLPAK